MLYNPGVFPRRGGIAGDKRYCFTVSGHYWPGNEQTGYFGAMCVLGLSGVVLLFVCFCTTKERYTFAVQPGASVAKDLKLLLGNGQWRIMCVFKMMATCSNVVRGGATL